jgi:hypothetical protein
MKAAVVLCVSAVLIFAAGCRCGCAARIPQTDSEQRYAEQRFQSQLTLEVQSSYGRLIEAVRKP